MCSCFLCAPHWEPSPTTQACALTGNRTGIPLVHRPALNPPSYTSQGFFFFFFFFAFSLLLPPSPFSSLLLPSPSSSSPLALTSVAQLVGHRLKKRSVAGLIPGQGTCLGCGFSPDQGASERQPIDVSLPLFLPPSLLSKNK